MSLQCQFNIIVATAPVVVIERRQRQIRSLIIEIQYIQIIYGMDMGYGLYINCHYSFNRTKETSESKQQSVCAFGFDCVFSFRSVGIASLSLSPISMRCIAYFARFHFRCGTETRLNSL